MNTYKIHMKGVSPLLMHSCGGANQLDPEVQVFKRITTKRKKTEEDILEAMRLEYKIGSYHNKELGFYIPAEVIESCIKEGAKVNKNGKNLALAVKVIEPLVKLIHDGPDDIDEMYQNKDFVDSRFVVVQRQRIIRTRPRFNRWELVFTIEVNSDILSQEDLINAIDNAGTRAGIGDYRVRYGKFVATLEQLS